MTTNRQSQHRTVSDFLSGMKVAKSLNVEDVYCSQLRSTLDKMKVDNTEFTRASTTGKALFQVATVEGSERFVLAIVRGDMELNETKLANAVGASGFDDYLGRKFGQALTDEPVDDLRSGWNLHVEFGLEHPAHYLLMYGQTIPGDRRPPAAEQASDRLHLLVGRIAEAGRLKVTVETGVAMISAACSGLTLMLIGTAPEDRDLDLSPRLRESMLASITGAPQEEARSSAQRAAGLKAVLDEAPGLLSQGERAILGELLDRLANAPATSR
jgi:hypothetical protein